MSEKTFTEKGVDLSHWNNVISFDSVKNAGFDFCILKAGGSDKGFYKDNKFEDYYRLAKLARLKVGAYYFAGRQFYGYESGELDAKRFLHNIYDKDFDYPLVIDVEMTGPKEKNAATEAVIGFCEYLESEGKYVSVYASDISGFKERLNIDYLTKYDKWVARYGKKPEYVKSYGIWQKTSTGKVPGIVGNVDVDISYKDYQKIILSHGLNRG